jgi:hypothetical protein
VDDNSSVSSGEISDAVAEMSTDDNLTTGSSLGAGSFDQPHSSNYWCPVTSRDTSCEMGSKSYGTTLSSQCHRTSSVSCKIREERLKKYAAVTRDQTMLPMVRQFAVSKQSPASFKVYNKDLNTWPNKIDKCGTAVAIDIIQTRDVRNAASANGKMKQVKDCETNTGKSAMLLTSHFFQVKDGLGVACMSVNNGAHESVNNDNAGADTLISYPLSHQNSEPRLDLCRAGHAVSEMDSLKDPACAADLREEVESAKSNNNSHQHSEKLESFTKYRIGHQHSASTDETHQNNGKRICFLWLSESGFQV